MDCSKLKFFCPMPWIGLAISPDSAIHPCCMTTMHRMGWLTKGNLMSQYNSEDFKNLRLEMLNNHIPAKCYTCSNGEQTGGYSLRRHKIDCYRKYYPEIQQMTNTQTGEVSKLLIKDTDIRPSNICNFKCQMCSTTCSSSHATAQNKKTPDCEQLILDTVVPLLDNIDSYHFAGGEPFLMESTYKIMDHYVTTRNKNVTIGCNTNLSVLKYKDKSVINYLNNFENLILTVSIDGYGKICEEQRVGCNWDTLVDNITQVRNKCPFLKMHSHTVVSTINAEYIPEFMDWLIKFKYQPKLLSKHIIQASSFNTLSSPPRLCVQLLPDETKVKIKQKYDKFKQDSKNISTGSFNIEQVLNYILKNMKVPNDIR